MMPPLSVLTAKQVVAALHRNGFEFARQKGSHATYRHSDGRTAVVPMHSGDIRRGTPGSILRQAGLEADELKA
ncbi:MAG: type II toxin-antitoxin system HicA family toxin [Thermoleophilia bacterium]|nr:type II toxin-antitoxin system HicA family toxin [Thermoleophilia bacterium]